jgi:hypothetical protein
LDNLGEVAGRILRWEKDKLGCGGSEHRFYVPLDWYRWIGVDTDFYESFRGYIAKFGFLDIRRDPKISCVCK